MLCSWIFGCSVATLSKFVETGANALLIKAVDNAAPAPAAIAAAVVVIRPDLNDSPNSIFVPAMFLAILLININVPPAKAADNPAVDSLIESTTLCLTSLDVISPTYISGADNIMAGMDNNPPSVEPIISPTSDSPRRILEPIAIDIANVP